MAVLARTRNVPELRWVRNFHDDAGVYRRAAPVGARVLGCARAPRQARHELSRPAAAQSRTGRPLPLRVRQDRAAAGRGAGPAPGGIRPLLPVPVRPRQVARALHGRDAARAGAVPAPAASTSSVRALPPTAWRRWRRSRSRGGPNSSRAGARSSMRLPASTIRPASSAPWPSWSNSTPRAGRCTCATARRATTRLARTPCAPRRWARGADAAPAAIDRRAGIFSVDTPLNCPGLSPSAGAMRAAHLT